MSSLNYMIFTSCYWNKSSLLFRIHNTILIQNNFELFSGIRINNNKIKIIPNKKKYINAINKIIKKNLFSSKNIFEKLIYSK